MCCSSPSPPHSGQAPNGLLNENSRGSISGMVKPDTGQANFSEKIRRWARVSGSAFASLPGLPGVPFRRSWITGSAASARPGDDEAESANSTTASPSASLRRCSNESASRGPMSRLHHQPVDHHVDVVGEFLVERRDVGDLVERAVDLDALVALLEELGQFLAVFALAAAHHRRQHDRCACLPAAPARGRPSATRSGSRSAGRSPASRARRCAPTAGACSRRSR